jgi:hypothetical protein
MYIAHDTKGSTPSRSYNQTQQHQLTISQQDRIEKRKQELEARHRRELAVGE